MIATALRILGAGSLGNCKPGGGFFNLPTWYMYLPGRNDGSGGCTPIISNINDVWLIVAAVVEILLQIAMIAAIAMVIYGGFQFITAQGDPGAASKARKTLTDAVIGLVIAFSAATLITFVAGSFK